MRDYMIFQEGLKKLQITLTMQQREQFQLYYEHLVEINKVMNLTAITEYEDVVKKHFLDSLSIVLWKGFHKDSVIIDVGTGAGFPGLPIKIAFPECKVLLLDSLNKRVKFLKDIIHLLGLKGVDAIHGRAEEIAKKQDYREKYDICVSRAVANLATLAEYCIPFVKKEGYFISYKSGQIEKELEESKMAIKTFGGRQEQTIAFLLPGTDIERTLVPIKKVEITPKKYPRKAGLPAKEPII